MADENVGSVEDQAKALGWVPQEEFRGNPANWVDAQEFLDRGEETPSALRSDRRRLLAKVQELEAKDTAREREIASIRSNVGELVKTSVAEARAKADADIKDLRKQLVEVRRSGTPEEEVEIEERLEEAKEARAAIKDEPAVEVKPAAKANGAVTPEAQQAMKEFVAENPWFNTDPVMAGAMNAVIYETIRSPEAQGMTPKQVLDKAAAQVRERFGVEEEEKPARRQKVETGGATVVNRGTRGRGYADLPAEAKATAMRQEARFVGPGKAFKTAKEWQDHYAENFDWREET